MKITKPFYIVLGCLGLGLGALGTVVPLLPSFPFLLLAAFCFARSSEKLHRWFLGTELYKQNLESYVKKRGMTLRTKLRIMTFVSLTMLIGFFMMGKAPAGQIALGVVWVCHVLYFIFGIRTLPAEKDAAQSPCSQAEQV